MITFFIRLLIILFAIFCISLVSFGFGVSPLGMACIFVCSWLTIISFKDVFWWVFSFSIIFGLLYYDVFGFLIVGIVVVAFLFDVIYVQVVRSANDTPIILYGITFLLSVIMVAILEVIIYHHIFFNLHTFIISIFVTAGLFLFFRFGIGRAERFISLYTHGTDMRCHT